MNTSELLRAFPPWFNSGGGGIATDMQKPPAGVALALATYFLAFHFPPGAPCQIIRAGRRFAPKEK